MGLFSEANSSLEAKRLAGVLIIAKSSESVEVFDFCKKYVYPLYQDAVGEAWEREDPEIRASFGDMADDD